MKLTPTLPKKHFYKILFPLLSGFFTNHALAQSGTSDLLIQAEEYSAFVDTDAGNNGGEFRSDDVDIETTTDIGGGFNVGWMETGEQLEYTVNLDAGTYNLNMRVASELGGANFSVSLDDNTIDNVDVGQTGGWQVWETLNVGTLLLADSGEHTLRINVNASNANLNWINIVAIAPSDSDNDGVNDSQDQCPNTPSGQQVDAQGCPVDQQSVIIESENYINFFDMDAGNNGGVFRNDDVDIEATTDTGGGFNVGWLEAGEFLEYEVNLSSGTYEFSTRVASEIGGGSFNISVDGEPAFTDNIGATGGWQNWETHTLGNQALTTGQHTIRIDIIAPGMNINWIKLTPNTPDDIDSDLDGVLDSEDLCPNTSSAVTVDSDGCPIVDSLLIEAENYTNFFDSDEGNNGGAFRNDDVDIEATTDIGGGFNVGWLEAAEFLEYSITVAAGEYELETRVASELGGGELTIFIDNNLVGNDIISATGGWQTWETHRIGLVNLSAGTHTLRIDVASGNVNLNWLKLSTNDGVAKHEVVINKELMITDLSIVESDLARTAWSFENLMEQMMPQANPTQSEKSKFVLDWLRHWTEDQTFGQFVARARTRINTTIINPWIEASGGNENALDFSIAPFRLLAIVNRMDLHKRDVDGNVLDAGEGRLVFGVTNFNDSNFDSEQFTVIFEYGLTATSDSELNTWANQWHALGALEFGDDYNQALAEVTRRFTQKNAAPGKANGSALNQLRTNEIALSFPWELREFLLNPTTGQLEQAIVQLTPDLSVNNTVALRDFINLNEADILEGTINIPTNLQTGSALVSSTSLALTAPGINNNDARHLVSLNSCMGCHAGETGTSFLHISPRNAGSETTLSRFLIGSTFDNDGNEETFTMTDTGGSSRTFGDLAARKSDLSCLVDSTTCN